MGFNNLKDGILNILGDNVENLTEQISSVLPTEQVENLTEQISSALPTEQVENLVDNFSGDITDVISSFFDK